MAATFVFRESNGGSPSFPGTTVTACDYKNIDDPTTPYTDASAVITAGNNSMDKFIYGHFSGTYGLISNGKFAHTSGTPGTDITLFGPVTVTANTTPPILAYRTPATTPNTDLVSYTTPVTIGTGHTATVWFSSGSIGNPATLNKAASTSLNPTYSTYLCTQLRSGGSAAPGPTGSFTYTFQYDES